MQHLHKTEQNESEVDNHAHAVRSVKGGFKVSEEFMCLQLGH